MMTKSFRQGIQTRGVAGCTMRWTLYPHRGQQATRGRVSMLGRTWSGAKPRSGRPQQRTGGVHPVRRMPPPGPGIARNSARQPSHRNPRMLAMTSLPPGPLFPWLLNPRHPPHGARHAGAGTCRLDAISRAAPSRIAPVGARPCRSQSASEKIGAHFHPGVRASGLANIRWIRGSNSVPKSDLLMKSSAYTALAAAR